MDVVEFSTAEDGEDEWNVRPSVYVRARNGV